VEKLNKLFIFWSTERELNPRILILQTSALATSPSVLISAAYPETSLRAAVQLVADAYFGCVVVRRYGFTVL
jgi:hypothetical protein